ncbi:MAG: hypothetical protein ABI746_13060 [Dermatophilaceae bacterium]
MKIVNHHAGCCGYLPVRPDGTEWPHVLGLPAGASVHADTPAEILTELIEGYEPLDAAGRTRARLAHATAVAAEHQERRIRQAIADHLVRLDDPDDAALIALLRAAAGRGLRLTRTDEPTDATGDACRTPRWEGALRLVCLTTAYAPSTDVPAPVGRVDWIDPTDERGYLVSLRRAGAADYWCEGWEAD